MNHLPVVTALVEQTLHPARLYLSQDPATRNVFLLPNLITALDDLAHLLEHTVRTRIPHSAYITHIQSTTSLHERLCAYERSLASNVIVRQTVTRISNPNGGRPVIELAPGLLDFYTNLGYADREIALHLGISRGTVTRRRRAFGQGKRAVKHMVAPYQLHCVSLLLVSFGLVWSFLVFSRPIWSYLDCSSPLKSNLDLISLDHQLVASILNLVDKQNTGERLVMGLLSAQQVKVTRAQLRATLRAQDPHGNMVRSGRVLHRRDYDVPFVNSVWHMDGQHKLINWKFVIHGAVDGKSRLIVFMLASDNNKSETVEDSFLQATQQWGWPSRVRADYGGENLGVRTLMNAVRGM